MLIDHLDHLVLTCADLEKTTRFYIEVLQMRLETFGAGRIAFRFGAQKINVHVQGSEFEPKAQHATPGTLDLCFIAAVSLDDVIAHLQCADWPIIAGPVERTGATGKILSIYVRDPESLALSERSPLRYHAGMNEISFPPFIIGVAGGSGSGKSTVTQQVLASFGTDMVSVVMQDDYYIDQSDLAPEVRRKQNYDHPQAFDWPLLVQHVQALHNGETIAMPEYDFTIDNRSDRTIAVKPAPVIVIEGLFALFDADLREMMSLKIFVDTAADVRFIRRMQRDIAERGRAMESIIGQYLDTVRPMHKQFIEPTKRHADVILPHGANGPAVDVITTKVASVIGQLKQS